jgi:hypothetical protein
MTIMPGSSRLHSMMAARRFHSVRGKMYSDGIRGSLLGATACVDELRSAAGGRLVWKLAA